MTAHQDILEKAIQKAIDGGWIMPPDIANVYNLERTSVLEGAYDCPAYFKQVIFNHDFAKALWGESELMCINSKVPAGDYCCGIAHEGFDCEPLPAWQYHLQMMVIANDPIKYLGEHLS